MFVLNKSLLVKRARRLTQNNYYFFFVEQGKQNLGTNIIILRVDFVLLRNKSKTTQKITIKIKNF